MPVSHIYVFFGEDLCRSFAQFLIGLFLKYWVIGIWDFEGTAVSMLISWFGSFVRDCPCSGKNTLDYSGMIGITSATCSEMVQESLFRWEMVHSSGMVISRDENEEPKIRWLGSFTEIWEFSNRERKGWRQSQGSFSGHLKGKASLQPLEWAKYKMCGFIFCLHTIYM